MTSISPTISEPITAAVAEIRRHGEFTSRISLILGSGLGQFADNLTRVERIPYGDIPHFPVSTVEGHSGELICGYLDDLQLLVMRGRVHFYEGYTLDQIVFPVRILNALGSQTLVITNAAGSIVPDYKPGDLMVIDRQMNLTGRSILREPEPIRPYLRRLGDVVERAGRNTPVTIHRGCYAGLTGPSYETPAEIRFLRHLGADAVGMSTIHETVMAFYLGMEILGISCLTNYAAGILDQPLSHAEVIATGKTIEKSFADLLRRVLTRV